MGGIFEREVNARAIFDASYATRLGEKLRQHRLVASHMRLLLIMSGIDWDFERKISPAASCQLPIATSYSPDLVEAALGLLDALFVEGHRYYKAGIMLD